jgi:hypothetical protein
MSIPSPQVLARISDGHFHDPFAVYNKLLHRLQHLKSMKEEKKKQTLNSNPEYLTASARYRDRMCESRTIEQRWTAWTSNNDSPVRADVDLLEKAYGKALALALADWPLIEQYFPQKYHYHKVLMYILESSSTPKRSRELSPEQLSDPHAKRARTICGDSTSHGYNSSATKTIGDSFSLLARIQLVDSLNVVEVAITSSHLFRTVRKSERYQTTDCIWKTPIEDSTDWTLGVYCANSWGLEFIEWKNALPGTSHRVSTSKLPACWQHNTRPNGWVIVIPEREQDTKDHAMDWICYFRVSECFITGLELCQRRDKTTPDWFA